MKLREPVPKPAWTGRPAIVGATVLAAALAACDEAPVEVAEVLTAACVDARDHLADVPAPVDEDSDLVFLEAADEAAQTVALAAEDLVTLGDDRSIADLVRHLRRFPRISDADRLPGVPRGERGDHPHRPARRGTRGTRVRCGDVAAGRLARHDHASGDADG